MIVLDKRIIGEHVIADLYGCNHEKLADKEYLEKLLLDSTSLGGATVLGHESHVLGSNIQIDIIVRESHISIYTNPESDRAAIDVYTCGNTNPYPIYENIRKYLRPKKENVIVIPRGVI